MAHARFVIKTVGPLVTIQDHGRYGFLRYGVPESGPMDRDAFEIAHAALGYNGGGAAIEVSLGGIALECVEGSITLAIAGGGFVITLDKTAVGSWSVVNVRAGSSVTIRPGPWGSWTYVAFTGRLVAKAWLGSYSTHASSGFGGGRITKGQSLEIEDAELREERAREIFCPAWARPRSQVDVVFGPQDRYFSEEKRERLVSEPFELTDAFDRMGVRLSGPRLEPDAALDMPSEPAAFGSIQISGDGVPTVLLADHQTTGGYPKIATVVSDQVGGLIQHRSRSQISFRRVEPEAAVQELRARREQVAVFLASLRAKPTTLLHRLMSVNLIDGVTSGAAEG
jgi:allophanate hydrolase